MTPFSNLSPTERAPVINEAAGRLGLVPLIVEKDFWVCWTLARIFEADAVAPHVVFKGGTSLSKVFGAIQRFSEDIDLAVSPHALGFAAADLDEAPSASQRRKRVQALEAECERCVSERFRPALEAAIVARLGIPQQTGTWLRYEIDALAGTPNLLFTYPSALPQAGGYIAKQVKLEFGALTDQQPTGRPSCQSATASRATMRTSRRCCATPAVPMRSPGSICSQTWWRHKSRFFSSGWTHCETAKPGTFKLVPPQARHAALARDYATMAPMFIGMPVEFDAMLQRLQTAEEQLNDGSPLRPT